MEDREPIKCPGWDNEYQGPPQDPEDQEPDGSDDDPSPPEDCPDDGYEM